MSKIKVLLTIVFLVVSISLAILYTMGVKITETETDRQVDSINAQIEAFDTSYTYNKNVGERYYKDIVNACITNTANDVTRDLYIYCEDPVLGIVDFNYSLDNGLIWDSYSGYLEDFSKNHNMNYKTLYEDLITKYKEYNYTSLSDDEKYELQRSLSLEENIFTFRFLNPKIESVRYFGSYSNNLTTQLIKIKDIDTGSVMYIDILWDNGKIKYLTRSI